MRLSVIVATFLFLFHMGYSATPADTFKLANDAYEKGAIDDAIQLYESIVSSNFKSAALYHNLATAYISTGQWPEARYYTEKALAENPLNPKIRTNLDYIKNYVGDPYPFPSFPLSGMVDAIHSVVGQAAISILLLLIFLAMIAAIWTRTTKWKPIIYGLSAIWVTLFCLFLIERHETNNFRSMGIVWATEVQLLDKPDDLANSLSPLNEGQKVRILESIGPWCRVDLADGSSGWLQSDKLRMLY